MDSSNYESENDVDQQKNIFLEIPIGSPQNVLDATDYENIIYRQMLNREREFPHSVVDLEITAEDRGFLIDWLNKIHYKAQLTTNTLYRAIGIFDRALNLTIITRETCTLFGLAALIIASKIEDTLPLTYDVAIICSSKKNITKDDLKKKEIQLVSLVDFDLSFPTAFFFLNYYLRIANMDQEDLTYARYVLDSALTSQDFFGARPSVLASTAIIISRAVFRQNEELWPQQL